MFFNAIKIEFPSSIINGCLFHWKQAIYRKVMSLKFHEPVIVWNDIIVPCQIFFSHSSPSLINFIEILEPGSRYQLAKLDNIRKGLVINRKRKRKKEDEVQKEKYNNVSIYYEQYVTSKKNR